MTFDGVAHGARDEPPDGGGRARVLAARRRSPVQATTTESVRRAGGRVALGRAHVPRRQRQRLGLRDRDDGVDHGRRRQRAVDEDDGVDRARRRAAPEA